MRTREGAVPDLLDVRDTTRDRLRRELRLTAVLDQAMVDPVLLGRLATDVVSTLHDVGVRISAIELKELLGISGATDLELLEVLRARLSRIQGASCGCGGSED